MHFTGITTLAFTLLSSTGLAAPAIGPWGPTTTIPTATIQIANEQSGANANAVIPVDGVKRPVQELWHDTSVAHNGLVYGTSAQLVQFDQTTVCTFFEEPRLSASLTAEKTYVTLGKPVIDLCFAYVVCECVGM